MKKTATILILLSALFGCFVIRINDNNYRDLTERERAHLRKFDPSVICKKVSNKPLYLYETDMEDIRSVLSNAPYTWVHNWVPYCPNDNCRNIGIFQEVVSKHPKVQFLMLATTYDVEDIKEAVDNSSFTLPVFVLKDSSYGHNIDKTRDKFIAQIKRFPRKIEQKFYSGDFLFKHDTLIYGWLSLETKLDSVLATNK